MGYFESESRGSVAQLVRKETFRKKPRKTTTSPHGRALMFHAERVAVKGEVGRYHVTTTPFAPWTRTVDDSRSLKRNSASQQRRIVVPVITTAWSARLCGSESINWGGGRGGKPPPPLASLVASRHDEFHGQETADQTAGQTSLASGCSATSPSGGAD
jgi:hypothetical protein